MLEFYKKARETSNKTSGEAMRVRLERARVIVFVVYHFWFGVGTGVWGWGGGGSFVKKKNVSFQT